MNKRADDLVARAAADSRRTTPEEKALYGPVVLELLEKAAKNLEDSQVAWHTFRDQYCNAIGLARTTGSGAGTAMEECLYTTATDRVRQLRVDFPRSADPKRHQQ